MAFKDLVASIPRERLQQMLDAGDIAPQYVEDAKAYLGPEKATIGEAHIAPPAVSAVNAGTLPPPRSDQPLEEPAVLRAGTPPNADAAFGPQQVVGSVIPRGVGNQFAAGLGLPTEGRGGTDKPPPETPDVSENNATYDALARSQQPPPAQPGGAADVLGGINLNAPEVRTNTQTSQALEGAGVKSQFAKSDAALARQQAAEQARAQHLAAAGADKAVMQQGYADQLKAGNDAYQAKVAARQEQVAGVERERAAASQAYQDEVKNAPLGTMLNPTASQAMGSAIAQALGAFGAGMSHSPNAALAILDKQLDAAQNERKVRIEGKAFQVRMADRHLQDLRDIFHDDDAAHLAWKADQFDLFSARLAKQATLTGNQDIIDQAAVGQEAAQVKAADLRAQALQAYDKKVASSTSVESGPMVALKAAEAKLKLQKEQGGQLPINWDKYEAWKDKDRAVSQLQALGGQNIPGALKRVVARYGSDVDSMNKAMAAGFAGVDLTDKQKDALSAVFRIRNAEIKRITGAASSDKERGAIVAGAGLGDYANPSDVMRSVARIAGELGQDRDSMIAGNGGYRGVFQAYYQAKPDMMQAATQANNGKVYGPLSGQ